MVAFPPCKINLGLHVLNRRADGYHDIDTCFYPIPRTDVLEIVPSAQFRFVQSGIDIPGEKDNNICVKAYRLLSDDFKLCPVDIYLHKVIPPGSGLGAGSADGAWTLRTLNDLFNLSLSTARLAAYAAQLGSDCAFFIYDKPMMGAGRGDQLSAAKLSLKGKYLVLVRPDVHISTQEAYQSVVPDPNATPVRSYVESLLPENWKGKLTNHFESHAFAKYPQIGTIVEDLYRAGALYASMSGSGSAVYGLFSSEVSRLPEFAGMDYWSGWLTA